MLFETEGFLESYKERNLYYKFFAGYFFNELIPGLDERLKKFAIIVNKSFEDRAEDERPERVYLLAESTHVTFDVHEFQFLNKKGNPTRGEFADIFIEDRKNEVCIAIEAKYRSNWDYCKDIKENCRRFRAVVDKMKKPKPRNLIQLLLVAESKWINGRGKKNHIRFEKEKWNDELVPKPGVLFWEDFRDLCPHDNPAGFFLSHQLCNVGKRKEQLNVERIK